MLDVLIVFLIWLRALPKKAAAETSSPPETAHAE